MKWFKHDTDSRNDTRIKLLKKKFGAEGYGVYFQLLEIVGQNIKDNNQSDWGFVEEIHTIETLADESGVSPDSLRTMLGYMNEIGLVYKLDHRLVAPKILSRIDEYAQKRRDGFDVTKRQDELIKKCRENIPTVSGECRGLEQIRTDKIRLDKSSLNTDSKNSDEFSELDKYRKAGKKQETFQVQAIEIIESLGIPKDRQSAYFKACKVEERKNILIAHQFASDYPNPDLKDKMFFFKLNQLKNHETN